MKKYMYWSTRGKIALTAFVVLSIASFNAFDASINGLEHALKLFLFANILFGAITAYLLYDLRMHRARLRGEAVKPPMFTTPESRVRLEIIGSCAAVPILAAWFVYGYQMRGEWLFDSFSLVAPLALMPIGALIRDLHDVREAKSAVTGY